ncbi:hypothetical protein M404DRAFT_16774 [Pisolithus tinctorius Marx 270]|uniref:DDE Tnp4 domain-containing protein n=1 Tax=Pisolithus tinctorius Marx 270 TaxID=870435 RepID=A0A0C3JID3_PISTI|nr:hypothetical protein M404DRAFT_16774 [Pisolithus tinctorius Marx 270]
MGQYGNGASLEDIACFAGCSEGAIELYTTWCFTAIESLHNDFVCLYTDKEKEEEKCWMDQHLEFKGTWREGWVMYDGTTVVLYAKPALNGDSYFTRKHIGNLPSNLQIVDYSHGLTGSAHDTWAFESTAAAKYPEGAFKGEEFAWVDSAYPLTSQTITVHKKPASLFPHNAAFDYAVANLHWMTIAIILHNIAIEVEGAKQGE